MGWDFETEPAFQERRDWINELVRSEIEPLNHVLWASISGRTGYGQVKLAMMNEILVLDAMDDSTNA